MRRRIFNPAQLGVAAVVLALAMPMRVGAAISEGPVLTNAAAAEQRRITDFYHAAQSFQEQLQAGQKRYNEKQVIRAKMVAAMAAELQARQQTVVIQPETASDAATEGAVSGFGAWPILALIAAALIGYGYYRTRQRTE